MKRFIGMSIFIVALLAVTASTTWAAPVGYIDPNTGGMIAQVLLVILASLSGVFYVFKNRLVMMWNRMRNSDDPVVDDMEQHAE